MTAKRVLLSLFLSAAALVFLLHPDISRTAAEEGLSLCIHALLPSLFPFLILTGFWNGSEHGAGGLFSQIWLPAAVGGYPTGAGLIADAYQRGSLSKQDAEYALLFCCNAGPAFTVGFLGVGILNNLSAGILLYTVHLAASLLIGRLFRPQAAHPTMHRPSSPAAVPFDCVHTILQAGQTMWKICVLVLAFGLFNAHLLALLPVTIRHNALSAAISAALELSGGIHRLSQLNLPLSNMLVLSAIALGWGGVCVCFQTASLLNGSELSLGAYIKGKLLHGLISGAMVCLIVHPTVLGIGGLLIDAVFLLGKSFTGKTAEHGL